MSLTTPSKTGAVRDCCVEGEGELLTVQKPRAVGLLPLCLMVKPVGNTFWLKWFHKQRYRANVK